MKAILIWPVKEFTAVARTCTCEPAWPAVRFTDAGDAERVKSGVGPAAEMVAVTSAE